MKMIFHILIPASISPTNDLKTDEGMDLYRRIEHL
jgi:hypothetical protein